jgi:hypothetical protein
MCITDTYWTSKFSTSLPCSFPLWLTVVMIIRDTIENTNSRCLSGWALAWKEQFFQLVNSLIAFKILFFFAQVLVSLLYFLYKMVVGLPWVFCFLGFFWSGTVCIGIIYHLVTFCYISSWSQWTVPFSWREILNFWLNLFNDYIQLFSLFCKQFFYRKYTLCLIFKIFLM